MIFRTDKPSFFRGFNEESESRLFLKRLETFWIRAARARVGLAPRYHNPFFLPMKNPVISLFYNLGNTTSRYDQLRPPFGQLLFDAIFFSVWKILREVARERDDKGDGSADWSSDFNAAPSRVLSNSLRLPLGTTPTNFTRNKLCYR